MVNPLYAAAAAARASRYARPQQSGYVPQVPEQEENDNPQPIEMQGNVDKSGSGGVLGTAASIGASGLSAVANVLDVPRSVANNLLTWAPGGAAPKNPFAPILDPFGSHANENRIEGRDLLRSHGLVSKRDTWGNFATGLAFEMATDPLTYMGAGVLGKGAAALAKSGLLANKADLLKEMAEASSKSSKYIGGRGSAKLATGDQLFKHWKATRDKIISDATDHKVSGKRLKGKNTYSSLKELEELNPKTLKDDNWAVVDSNDEYKVFQWKVPEKGGEGKWNEVEDATTAIMGSLRNTHTAHSLDTIRDVYATQFRNMYPDVDPQDALKKPLESLVSFRLPFGKSSLNVNVPNAGSAFDNWLSKQPDAVQHNVDDAAPPPGAAPGGTGSSAGPSPGPTPKPSQKAPAPLAEEIEANADAWGLRNPDGSVKTSKLGPEATRVLHQAAKTFGPKAVDTWDIVETAAVGAAKLKGIEPEEFFKNLTIDRGTVDDLERLKKGGGLEQSQPIKTETPEFKNWFGDWQGNAASASKAVDKEGKPLVVYHGTSGEIENDTFRVPKGDEPGIFFTDNPQLAGEYALPGSKHRETYNKPDWVKAGETQWSRMTPEDQLSAIKAGIGSRGGDVDEESMKALQSATRFGLAKWIDNYISQALPAASLKESPKKTVLKAIDETILEMDKFVKEAGGDGANFLANLKTVRKAIDSGDVKYNPSTGDITSEGIDAFIKQQEKILQQNIEHSRRTAWAENYNNRTARSVWDEFGGTMTPAYLDIKNPLVIHYGGKPFRPGTASNAIAEAKRGGHDGVIIKGVRDDAKGNGNNPRFLSDQYIVFSPNQIKSATANSGKYDPSNPSILAQLDEPGTVEFYSKLQRTIDDKVGGKIGWDQLKATLKKAGVKDEEVEDIGLQDLFADGKPKTKAEVNKWLDDNKIEIEVSQRKDPTQAEMEILNKEAEAAKGDWHKSLEEARSLYDEAIAKMYKEGSNPFGVTAKESPYGEVIHILDKDGATIDHIYLVPGDSADDAIRMFYEKQSTWRNRDLPPELKSIRDEYFKKADDIQDNAAAKYDEASERISNLSSQHDNTSFAGYQVPGGDEGTYREILITKPVKYTHGKPRWLDQEGSRVVSNSEDFNVQIYKAKAGGDSSGFRVRALNKDFPQVFKTLDEAKEFASQFLEDTVATPTAPFYKSPHFDEPNVVAHLRADDVTLPDGKKAMRIQEVQSDWHQQGKRVGYDSDRGKLEAVKVRDGLFEDYDWEIRDSNGNVLGTIEAPDAEEAISLFNLDRPPSGPFKKSWATLALKQALKEAVEGGYDELHIVAGKDIAKAVGGPEDALGTFYDSILNKDMKNLTKKWGSFQGIKQVGDPSREIGGWVNDLHNPNTRILTQQDSDDVIGSVTRNPNGTYKAIVHSTQGIDREDIFNNFHEAKFWVEKTADASAPRSVQVFKITPEMRADLLKEGLPLYQKVDDKVKGAIFFKNVEMAIKAFANGDISTLHHEFAHGLRRMLDDDTLAAAEKAIAARMKNLGIDVPVVGKNGKWTREAEEVFARSWERYLKEGKSPVKGLEGSFAKLKEWLTDIYKMIVQHPSLAKKLDAKTRKIFDHILATGDAELRPAANAADINIRPLPSSPLQDAANGKKRSTKIVGEAKATTAKATATNETVPATAAMGTQPTNQKPATPQANLGELSSGPKPVNPLVSASRGSKQTSRKTATQSTPESDLSRIHDSLEATVGSKAAQSITQLVKAFADAGNNPLVLKTTIDSMSPADAVAMTLAAEQGNADILAQKIYMISDNVDNIKPSASSFEPASVFAYSSPTQWIQYRGNVSAYDVSLQGKPLTDFVRKLPKLDIQSIVSVAQHSIKNRTAIEQSLDALIDAEVKTIAGIKRLIAKTDKRFVKDEERLRSLPKATVGEVEQLIADGHVILVFGESGHTLQVASGSYYGTVLGASSDAGVVGKEDINDLILAATDMKETAEVVDELIRGNSPHPPKDSTVYLVDMADEHASRLAALRRISPDDIKVHAEQKPIVAADLGDKEKHLINLDVGIQDQSSEVLRAIAKLPVKIQPDATPEDLVEGLFMHFASKRAGRPLTTKDLETYPDESTVSAFHGASSDTSNALVRAGILGTQTRATKVRDYRAYSTKKIKSIIEEAAGGSHLDGSADKYEVLKLIDIKTAGKISGHLPRTVTVPILRDVIDRLSTGTSSFETLRSNKIKEYNLFDTSGLDFKDTLMQLSAKNAAKAFVQFKRSGEAAIKIITGVGDASSAIHELSHVFRRNLKSGLTKRAEKAIESQLNDKDVIENILSGKSGASLKDSLGNWTREAEEVWARLFERYMRDGVAPTSALKEVFDKIASMMKSVYKTLAGNPEINAKINPELKAVFDEMLGKPSPKPKKSNQLIDAAHGGGGSGGSVSDNLLTETSSGKKSTRGSKKPKAAPASAADNLEPTSPASVENEASTVVDETPTEMRSSSASESADVPVDEAPYVPPAIATVDEAKSQIMASKQRSDVLDVIARSPAEHVSELEDFARSLKIPIDEQPPAKPIPKDVPIEGADGAPAPADNIVADAAAPEIVPTKPLPQSAADDLVNKARSAETKVPVPRKSLIEAARKTAAKVNNEERTLQLLRDGADGDIDALTELGFSKEEAAGVADDPRIMQGTTKERAVVLARRLEYPDPDVMANKAVATNEVVEEAPEVVTRRANQQAAIKKANTLIENNGVFDEMVDRLGTADNPDEMAISILRNRVSHALKSPDQAERLHEKLLEFNDDYRNAVRNLGKRKADDAVDYTKSEKNALSKIIDDPEFKSVPESDILSPPPRRITEEDVQHLPEAERKQAVSDNERDVDRHQFRKLHYLKSQGRNDEATQIVNELAEHYLELPKIAAIKTSKAVEQPSLYDDFVANGNLNLIDAINRFDYTPGYKFSTFATGNLHRSNLKHLSDVKTKILGVGGSDKETATALANASERTVREEVKDADHAARLSEAIMRSIAPKYRKLLELEASGILKKDMAVQLGVSKNTLTKRLKAAKEEADSIRIALANSEEGFAQAETLKREALKSLYTQNRAALDKVVSLVASSSLRERYARMLDVGDHLFLSSPPVRAFNRYFDKSTHGLNSYEEQRLARKRYRAAKRAVFESRELLAAITQAVGEHGLIDETATIRQMVSGGMKVADAKKAARDLINRRNSEMVRYMEGAVDKDGLKSGLPHDLFINEDVANEVEGLLKAIKTIFPNRLFAEGLAGLSNRQLADTIDYFPRSRYFERGPRSKGMDIVDDLYDTSLASQKKRKDAFRDVPGGGAVLNELSTDPNISGTYWTQARIGKTLSRKFTDSLVEQLLSDRYRNRVFKPEHFDEAGKLTKEGRYKARRIVSAMAKLPKFHSANNIPIFGNNMLHTMAKYIQDSIAAEGVARVAQDIVAKNVLPEGVQSTYTIGKLFSDINLDRHQAYLNVIDSTGRRAKYKQYARERIARIKKDLGKGKEISYDGGDSYLKLGDDGAIYVVEKAEDATKAASRVIPNELLAEELNFAKTYANDIAKMSVDKETFEAATQHLVAWRVPKEISDLQRAFNAALMMFKMNVTLPFLSFHVRNGFSGLMQNVFYKAYDPTTSGPYRYIKPMKQTITLRNGGVVQGLYKEFPKHIQKLVDDFADGLTPDEAATRWVREQVFKYGITGDKQGYAAEQIGESFQNLISQLPGHKKREASFKNLWGFLREPQVGVTLKDRANLLHVRGGGRPAIVEDDLGAKRIGVKPYEETTSTLHRTGEDLALATEDVNRISPFIAFMKQGNLPEEAARKVQRIQIDYSDLTTTEKTIRQWIPFYTFSSKMMYLTLGDLFQNPGGRQAWTIRTANRAHDPEALAPEHLKRGVAIPVGKTATGADRYLSGLGLAFEDPLQFAGILQGDARGFAGELVGRLRPEAQGLAELATGRSLFFDRNLEDMDPQAGRAVSNIKSAFTGEKPKGLAEPFVSPGVEWFIGKSPASRYVSTITKATDTRKSLPYKLANTASGFRFTDVEPEAQERIAVDMASQLIKEGYGGREFSRTYVPDWQKERLSEEKRAQLDSIQSFIQDVQKQIRDRKKQAEGLKVAVSGQAGDF